MILLLLYLSISHNVCLVSTCHGNERFFVMDVKSPTRAFEAFMECPSFNHMIISQDAPTYPIYIMT